MRHATLLVADDFYTSLIGKTTLTGIYMDDIVIPHEVLANQLIFFFIVEADPTDLFEMVTLYVELPGGDKRELRLPLDRFIPSRSDKVRWTIRYPLLFQMPTLKAGPIISGS